MRNRGKTTCPSSPVACKKEAGPDCAELIENEDGEKRSEQQDKKRRSVAFIGGSLTGLSAKARPVPLVNHASDRLTGLTEEVRRIRQGGQAVGGRAGEDCSLHLSECGLRCVCLWGKSPAAIEHHHQKTRLT
jgi:hypothetical protein